MKPAKPTLAKIQKQRVEKELRCSCGELRIVFADGYCGCFYCKEKLKPLQSELAAYRKVVPHMVSGQKLTISKGIAVRRGVREVKQVSSLSGQKNLFQEV